MQLTKNEFMLCVDSTNGLALYPEEFNPAKLTVKDQVLANVQDSISIDHLDEKWEIDKKDFLQKMENGSEEEYKQLWQRIQEFWERRDREDHS